MGVAAGGIMQLRSGLWPDYDPVALLVMVAGEA
jgi:hypothetical protein